MALDESRRARFQAELVMSYALGSLDAPTTQAEWAAAVRSRGNVPTVFPDGPNKGYWAERYIDSAGAFRYASPPANIVALNRSERMSDARAITAGAAATIATGILSPTAFVAQSILGAPRSIISNILGIPPIVVTAVAIGIGYMFLKPYLPASAPRRRRR